MKKLLVALTLALFLLSATGGIAFDKKPSKALETFLEERGYNTEATFVRIVTIGTAKGAMQIMEEDYSTKWVYGIGSFQLHGMGVVMKNNYIITAAHVVNPSHVEIRGGSMVKYVTKALQVYKKVIYIAGTNQRNLDMAAVATVVFIDDDQDIALLRYHGDSLVPTLWEMAPTEFRPYGIDFLGEGDAVAMLRCVRDGTGWFGPGYEVIHGKILSGKVLREVSEDESWFSPFDFTIDVKVKPGDSGSALFAFENGVPVMIGIVRAVEMLHEDGDNEIMDSSEPVTIQMIPWGAVIGNAYASRIDNIKFLVDIVQDWLW